MDIFSVLSHFLTIVLFIGPPIKIWEGDEVENGFLFVANLEIRTPENPSARCSAVLVENDVLLIAAHCLKRRGVDHEVLNIMTGSYDYSLGLARYMRQENPIVFMGGYFNEKDGKDLAIIFLEPASFDYGFHHEKAQISTIEPVVGDDVEVAGFGRQDPHTYPDRMLHTDMKMVANPNLKPDQMQFNKRYEGAAPGDSGGPLMLNGKLAGIISLANHIYRENRPQTTIAMNLNNPVVKAFLNDNGVIWD